MTAVLDSHQLAAVREALHRPNVGDAARRAPVRCWLDGHQHFGRLVFWPSCGTRRRGPSRGAKATVLLPSGAHLSVPCGQVWLTEPLPTWGRTERVAAVQAEVDLADALDAANADREALS